MQNIIQPITPKLKKIFQDDDIKNSNDSSSMVRCPICQQLVKECFINQHIDSNCDDQPESSSAVRNQTCSGVITIDDDESSCHTDKLEHSFPGIKTYSKFSDLLENDEKKLQKENKPDNRTRKAGVAYHTLKDKSLRDILRKDELCTIGSKADLIKRHQLWVHMYILKYLICRYNANMDAAARLSDLEIRKNLENQENIINMQKPPSLSLFGRNHEFDSKIQLNTQEHLYIYREEFKQMVDELMHQKEKRLADKDLK
jgi:hypothetical protein